MAGVFDKINKALTPGTTSGLDAAMQAHADLQHPVSAPSTTKVTESDKTFSKPVVKPAGGYAFHLPSDDGN